MTISNYPIAFGAGLKLYSVAIGFADLAALSGSGAKTIGLTDAAGNALTFGTGSFMLAYRIKASTAFAGTSITALTIQLGKSGGATNFFAGAFDIFQAVADGNLTEGNGSFMGQLTAVTPQATFTPTGGNCSAMTAGQVNIDLLIATPSTPNAL